MKKIFIAIFAFAAYRANAQHLLTIPDTLSGTAFNLTVHPDSVHFKSGPYTQTFGVNASKYLGPTLMIKKGDSINITVNNQMGDTTTMHWHGLHLSPQNDGGPFSMIMDGMSWTPGFMVRNNAATYWYHPHMMAKTAAQAIKGDAGMIIVRDAAEAALNLPRTYGVDDFPIIVQSLELDTLNQFMPKGMVDSVVLVNGTDTPYVSMPAQAVRMRLLNASGERTFNFGFTGNKSFNVIANDGGLLSAPVSTTRIRLSPGERAEVLVDLGGMNGQTLYLMSYASEIPMGVQGGPTMPMPPGSPLMNSPLNGINFNILEINVGTPTATPVTSIPTSLVSDSPYPVSSASVIRRILMSADSMMVMDGPFYLNGNKYDMDRIDFRIGLNNTEIWSVKDSTMVGHPFHMHGFHFYVLDRNGVAVAPKEAGRKDVVLVQPNETVRLIARFDDFADTTVPYMFHCHILMHEDDGMMGQFKVGAEYLGVARQGSEHAINVYPNPASGKIYVACPEELIGGPRKATVYDITGREMFESVVARNLAIDVSRWPKGAYVLSVISGETAIRKSFVVE